MTLKEWFDKNRSPVDGDICAPPMSADDAASVLVTELFDDDFLIGYPGSAGQILTEVVCAVVKKYGKKK